MAERLVACPAVRGGEFGGGGDPGAGDLVGPVSALVVVAAVAGPGAVEAFDADEVGFPGAFAVGALEPVFVPHGVVAAGVGVNHGVHGGADGGVLQDSRGTFLLYPGERTLAVFEFVCDPLVDEVPVAGAGSLAVASRFHAGQAVRWVPGGDVRALGEFLGWPATESQLLEPKVVGGESGFFPVDLSFPCVWVKPAAGDPWREHTIDFPTRFATVLDVKRVLTVTVESVTEVKDEPDAASSGEAVSDPSPSLSDAAEGVAVAGETSLPATPESEVQCPVCDRTFKNEQGLRLHTTRFH